MNNFRKIFNVWYKFWVKFMDIRNDFVIFLGIWANFNENFRLIVWKMLKFEELFNEDG